MAADAVVDQFLRNRRALVTASSRNLGAAIATALAGHGASVCVQYHQAEATASQLVQTLTEGTRRQHGAVRGDMSDPASVSSVISEAKSLLGGGLDILVNNAGPFSMKPYAILAEDEWDTIWNTNVKASYLAAQAVSGGMRGRGWGRIVNISAASAYLRNHSIYSLAKNGLIFLTEQLALELGPEINVNGVAPGQIAESAEDIAPYDPTFVDRAIEHTPAGRLVTRAEVAELVALLCGPAFDMVTGVTLPVDGGWRFNRF
jgi:NAD(P)-dependent dehydrogenase (short-subunit alcohol dehydrogenase family)